MNAMDVALICKALGDANRCPLIESCGSMMPST